jgi:hypothetical protein
MMPMLDLAPPSQASHDHQTGAERPSQTTIPISLQSNPDAIALRSALSILQLQRAQSTSDLQTLETIKTQAASSVEAFTHEVRAGRITMGQARAGLLGPEVSNVRPAKRSRREVEESENDDHGTDESQEEDDEEDGDESMPDEASVDLDHQTHQFPSIPGPQNIVRCPPINWSKYHIVGESLDKLHEEQKTRPISGEPSTDRGDSKPPAPSREPPSRAEEALIAAPLRPLAGRDDVGKRGKNEGVQTRRKRA